MTEQEQKVEMNVVEDASVETPVVKPPPQKKQAKPRTKKQIEAFHRMLAAKKAKQEAKKKPKEKPAPDPEPTKPNPKPEPEKKVHDISEPPEALKPKREVKEPERWKPSKEEAPKEKPKEKEEPKKQVKIKEPEPISESDDSSDESEDEKPVSRHKKQPTRLNAFSQQKTSNRAQRLSSARRRPDIPSHIYEVAKQDILREKRQRLQRRQRQFTSSGGSNVFF